MVCFCITELYAQKKVTTQLSQDKKSNGIAHDLNQVVYNAIYVSWEISTSKGHLLCDSHGPKRI